MKLPDGYDWPEPPPHKVYCGQCRYRSKSMYPYGYWYCVKNPQDTYLYSGNEFSACRVKNSRNDCAEFKPKPPRKPSLLQRCITSVNAMIERRG